MFFVPCKVTFWSEKYSIKFLIFYIADINECLPNGGLGPCAQNCTNTIGSFYCSCNTGYSISGYACNGRVHKSYGVLVNYGMGKEEETKVCIIMQDIF